MMRTLLVLLFAATVFGTGCQKTSFDAELETIDSMQVTVEAVQQKLTQYDAGMLKEHAKKANKQLTFIANNWMKEDTLPKPAAVFLSSYKANKKSLQFYAEQINRMEEEATYTLAQLSKLRGDIKNDMLTKEQVKEFLSDENQAVTVLVEGDIALDDKYTKIVNEHINTKVLVDSVILDMNKRGIR